jgi:hypothetical protein
MATMISEVYDALLEAGASEEKARKAAEAVAAYDQRFAVLETRMVELGGRVALVQWMVGTNIVLTLGILWKLLKL